MQHYRDFRILKTGEKISVYSTSHINKHSPINGPGGPADGPMELFTEGGTSVTENGGRWYIVPDNSPDDIEIVPID
ncbi:hypothetical protein [Halomonas elongata]|uniref:hypothetical protein n=1 Tax=Halomonas elongata TaxID=2746 RepID=UPI00403427B4